MAKQGGLGGRFFIGGTDLSGNTQTWKTSGGPAVGDVTTIDQSAHSRLGLLRDGSMGVTVIWDPVLEHPVLSALPTADVIATVCIGAAIGQPAASIVAKQPNYDATRAADGMFTFAADAVGNGFGLEWGNLLTAGMRTDTAATAGASFDTGGSLSFGAQAYLHAAAFTGTDVTVKLQDSADNTSFADISGMAFTQITGSTPLAQRISVANTATIRRYVRASTVTTGGVTSVTFAVMLAKNPVAGVVF